jgi:hypothetical protein
MEVFMKKLSYLALLTLFVLACSALSPSVNPPVISQSAIQTAIAQTQTASVPMRPPATNPPAATSALSPTQAPPTLMSPSTSGNQIGTFNNPVPIGTGYKYPGFGTLTVINSGWLPNQTGMAIVKLSFTCERPAGQECDLAATESFQLSVLGNSGNGYNQEFNSTIPEPGFGVFDNPPLYGGGTQTGYVGFLITGNENSLLMRAQIFLQQSYVYIKISN